MKIYRIQQKNFNSITQSTLSVEDGTKFQFIPTGKEDMYNVAYITDGSKENIIRCKRLVNSFQFLLPYDKLWQAIAQKYEVRQQPACTSISITEGMQVFEIAMKAS